MKKLLAVFTAALCFLVFSLPASAGLFKPEAQKAQENITKAIELMEIGLIDEANKLLTETKTNLEQALLKNTHDNLALLALAETNFFLGDDKNMAHRQFRKTCERDASLCKNAAEFYLVIAKLHLKMGHHQSSINYRLIACDFDNKLKLETAEYLFQTGSKFLFSGQLELSDLYFTPLYLLSRDNQCPDYRPMIVKALYTYSEKVSDPKLKMASYRRALNLEPENPFQNQIIQVAAVTLKENPRPEIKNEVELIRKEYRVIIWEIAFPPDYIVYPRGEHPIPLKAGQITEKWITVPSGTRISGIGSKDNKFKILYPNGDILNAWEIKKLPNRYKFKFQAVTDQNLVLKVK